MRSALLLLLALPLHAQDLRATFTPDTGTLGPWQRYAVRVSNPMPTAQPYTGAWLHAAALQQRIQLATYSALERARDEAHKRSWQRNALLVLEAAGYLTTALAASDLVHIKEQRLKGIVASAPGILRIGTTAIRAPVIELPRDLPPVGRIEIPAGGTLEFTAYGIAFSGGAP